MLDKSRGNRFIQCHFTFHLGGSALRFVDLLDVLFDALEFAHNGVFSGVKTIESQVCYWLSVTGLSRRAGGGGYTQKSSESMA